ncbi:hypothetical protein CTheo_8972 [Ceratobasidium theobromae]|uniref:Wax synthase domain-containing protein n=1 Tax=Ceratobasidium theobromae TaxID=1582974 RepID=A0A5N5Q7D3_9AGAM|nr:hypothetical protein CTheo_8972 [Ceratobasidium theobromae]
MSTLAQPMRRKSKADCPRSLLLSLKQLMDSVDFSLDARGLHWNLGHDCRLPTEIRDTTSLFKFEVDTFFMACKHTLAYAALHMTMSFAFSTGTISGGTIFIWARVPFLLGDVLVPPFLTACVVTLLTGLMMYNALMAAHLFVTFLLAPFYTHPAKSWPLLFGNPLHATSVKNFWTHQWHSLLRNNFCSTGGRVGWEIGGGIGAVLGVFLVSGLLHDFGLWCMGQGTKFSCVTTFYVLQGLIVLLEKAFDTDILTEVIDAKGLHKVTFKASITKYTCPNQTIIIQRKSLVHRGLGSLWTAFWIVAPSDIDDGCFLGAYLYL